jgi:ribonucleoside-diphosphate reductase alpha chain
MGFADMLYQLGIPYNSSEGRQIARSIMSSIQQSGSLFSQALGEAKGNFPNWPLSVFSPHIPRRNAAITNVAPTGTIAMMFDVSGGVEPYFALAYHYKGILGGQQLRYVNKHLTKALEKSGVDIEKVMPLIERDGTLQKISSIPEEVKRVFVTSMDISAEDHVLMQAAFQESCDNAISKTINFPNEATPEDILKGYLLAWKKQCKGCTVYRDGSRVLQVLNLNTKAEGDQQKQLQQVKEERVGREEFKCQNCEGEMREQEGCLFCPHCGYSACSL